MKSFQLLLLPATALLMAGCAKSDGENSLRTTELTITATIGDELTKTTLVDGGTDVYWESGDEIKVFYGSGSGRFTSSNEDRAKSTEFTGSIDVVVGGYEEFPNGNKMWGLYPYRADASYDGSSVITTLPDYQTGKAGSFAKSTNIAMAVSSNLALAFYNVCGGVCLTLTRDDITDVILEGHNDEELAGKVAVTFDGGIPVVESVSDGKKTITLTAPGGGTFTAGVRYYIVALPCTLSNGFKLTLNTATKYAVLSKSESKTVQRGIFGIIENADQGLTFEDKTGPQSGNIVFKDQIAKFACVSKFDTNKDGELSYAEAAAVTDISGMFDSWKTVTSFDELKYFTSLTDIGQAMRNLESLKSVTLPVNVTEIPCNAFERCSSLDSLTIDSKLITKIGGGAFYGCSAIKSFEFFKNLKIIEGGAFSGCTSLKSVILPSSLTEIGGCAFEGCASLDSIVVPNSVTSFDYGAFKNCYSLVSATLPSGLTKIPYYTFENCIRLKNFTFPEGITKIEDGAFHFCYMTKDGISKIDIPSGVTEIGRDNFERVRNVFITNTSMVKIASTTFGSHTKVYVPSNMVSMYKASSDWIHHSPDCIFALEDYSGDEAPSGTVDMGGNVFWMTCNLGASNPEEYGDYYAWGETEPYYQDGQAQSPAPVWKQGKTAGYDWTSYKWCNGTEYSITKYNTSDYYGDVDGKVLLEKADDAASQKLGSNYCIPSQSDWKTLYVACTWTETEMGGVSGYEVKSEETGNSIFLPNTGKRSGTSLYRNFGYWASENHNCMGYYAGTGYTIDLPVEDRCHGLAIRPVSY